MPRLKRGMTGLNKAIHLITDVALVQRFHLYD
jgi:hypothetical protein